MIYKLSRGEVAEIKELYDGSYASIRDISQSFKIDEHRLRWVVNHENYRKKQTERTNKWNKENVEKVREIRRRACRNYYKNHKEEIAKRQKKYREKNIEKIREYWREYHRKKRVEKQNKIKQK